MPTDARVTRRQYRNPPIDEAVCEIQYLPSTEWDPTVPGRLYEHVREEYPGKPQQPDIVFQAGLQPGGREPGQLRVKPTVSRVRFPTAEGRRFVMVGSDVLSVHMLKPYQPGWDEFRPRIETASQAYRRVAAPSGIRRIGIRYINRIVIPSEQFELRNYFTMQVITPDALPQEMNRFLLRTESDYPDHPATLIVTFASLPASESPVGQSAFVLDLDVVRAWNEDPLPVDELMRHVDDLRERERVAFEALITDRARDLFDAA